MIGLIATLEDGSSTNHLTKWNSSMAQTIAVITLFQRVTQ